MLRTMFIIFLRFSRNKAKAAELVAEHRAWIERGFDEGVFLLVGSLQPSLGGAIVAHGVTRDELERRIAADPFVVHAVVEAEWFELSPNQTDPRLAFLLA